MRWIVDRGIGECAAGALAWVRAVLEQYDTSRVGWIRVDRGGGASEACTAGAGTRPGSSARTG